MRFTWLGPLYDNSSVVNGTCNDLAKEKKLKNTPCKSPLVITRKYFIHTQYFCICIKNDVDDGSLPNMTYLWENHRDNILCRKAKGQSCVRYSYSFNNECKINMSCRFKQVLNLNDLMFQCKTLLICAQKQFQKVKDLLDIQYVIVNLLMDML